MINLHNIDCVQFMQELPDKAYELAIVDPPYGIGDFVQEQWKGRKHNRDWKCEWNFYTPGKEYFNELKRVSKNYIIWGANYYKEFITDPGTIIWDKGNNSGMGSCAELASTNIFNRVVMYFEHWTGFINSEQAKGSDKIHPCQKPVALYKWLLSNYAKKGDKIFDSHGGSMSIAIACYDLGFDLDLCELDPDYFAAGKQRLDDHIAKYAPAGTKPINNKGQLKLF